MIFKSKWQSRTLWVNSAAFLIAILQLVFSLWIIDPALQTTVLAVIATGVNFALRFYTNSGIRKGELDGPNGQAHQ